MLLTTICLYRALHNLKLGYKGLRGLRVKKKEWDESHSFQVIRPNELDLELIPQPHLHNSCVRKRAGVLAKRPWSIQGRGDARGIEADRVGHVEHLPSQLQFVALFPWHWEGLSKPHVEVHKAAAAKEVACTNAAWQSILEGKNRLGRIGEDIRSALLIGRAGENVTEHADIGYGSGLGPKSRVLPIRREEESVSDRCRQTGSDPEDRRELPSADYGVDPLRRTSQELLALADRQLPDCVYVCLVG